MTWQSDLDTIAEQNIALTQHKAILGYTISSTRAAIREMRAATGPVSDVLHQRADECESALEVLIEFHDT